MKTRFLISPLLAAVMLAGCDEGRIYDDSGIADKTGATARLTASVSGADGWSDGYTLALAGFADGNDYALISKNVRPDSDGSCDAVLEGIPAEVSTVELCVIDRLRRRVASFASSSCSGSDITLDAGNVDVSMSAAIQHDIFNTTCVNCHGASSHAAASLHLGDGVSFRELVGVTSRKEPDRMRVCPDDASQSVLYRILSSTESASWSYDHSVEVVSDVKLNLVRDWINSGANY